MTNEITKRLTESHFEDIIDIACYGAIISLEGDLATKADLKRYAYEVEIMEENRNRLGREVRFYGKLRIQDAISDYIDEYYPEVEDDDEEFIVYQ